MSHLTGNMLRMPAQFWTGPSLRTFVKEALPPVLLCFVCHLRSPEHNHASESWRSLVCKLLTPISKLSTSTINSLRIRVPLQQPRDPYHQINSQSQLSPYAGQRDMAFSPSCVSIRARTFLFRRPGRFRRLQNLLVRA